MAKKTPIDSEGAVKENDSEISSLKPTTFSPDVLESCICYGQTFHNYIQIVARLCRYNVQPIYRECVVLSHADETKSVLM